jgi:archaellum component FlaD/FlaE
LRDIPVAVVREDEGASSTADERRAAFFYLSEAWEEARLEGIDGDCLAQVALFAALGELVTTYGEDATARFAEALSARIRRGEFTLQRGRQ